MRKAKKLVLLLSLLMLFWTLDTPMKVSAYVPYETYTYDTHANGDFFLSPHAYVPEKSIDSYAIGLETALNNPSDLFVDKDGYVYIADTGNNRIVVLDENYGQVRILTGYTTNEGETSEFNQPKAVFVNDEGHLYVGDTLNNRIVVFDSMGQQMNVFDAPSEELLQNVIFEPSALVVDNFDRIYVVSQSTNMGILALDSNGVFQGFIGAEKTTGTFMDIVKDFFRTDAQKARLRQNVPTEYNNINIDKDGFIYVTSSALDAYEQHATTRRKEGSAHPIKKLNPAGTDVMKRNGAFNQGGDLIWQKDVSRFIDIALTDNNVYSALDSTGGKIFTYDGEGNLLYAFGGKGSQLGVFQMPVALTYKGDDLLVLDARTASITVFNRTEYGEQFAKAINLQNNRKYTEAAKEWEKLLQMNSNYEQAYNGIATAYMRMGKYKEAMENYRYGNDLDGYGEAYAAYRKNIMEHFILLIPIAVIVLVIIIRKISERINRVNEAGWSKVGKPSLKEELCFGWYVIFHPFDGFYELKRSKKGGLRGATVILTVAVLEDLFRQIATGYIVTGKEWARVSVIDAFMSIGFLVLLWTVANWALTTLMDGKGRMRDIYIASCYALIPMILLGFPTTLLTNICTTSELQFIHFFYAVGTLWTVMLIFFGALVTNDYSLLKNIVTTAASVVGMAFIAFVGVLTINLFVSLFGFVKTLANEIIYRI